MIKNIDALRTKVKNEYEMWLNHVQTIRDSKREADQKVLENPQEGFTKQNLLWKHMQLETATFLTDQLDIVTVSEKGVLEDEITDNRNKVAKHLYRKMWVKKIKRHIIDDNNLYGISATFIEAFDDDEVSPILSRIDPLSIIPDPKNYCDSEMRFIGLEKQMSISYVRDNEKFDKKARDAVVATTSEEWRRTEQGRANAYWLQDLPDDTMTSIKYFFTTFEGYKYLTIWDNTFENLLRQVELAPMTKAEKLNPWKVRFPIQLHRRKPIPNSFFGASLYDEVIQYQKNMSELGNLYNISARRDALGSDYLINYKLGLNAEQLDKTQPWGAYHAAKFDELWWEAPFVELPHNKSSGAVLEAIKFNDNWAQETSGNRDIAFGSSAPWSQTKAEVQIMEQKASRIHRMIRDNYMDSYEKMWEDIFNAFELYMWEKQTLNVALWDDWKSYSRTLRKREFLSGSQINIYVVSQEEKKAQDEQDYQKLIASTNLILPNVQSDYAKKVLLRTLLEKSGISELDPLEVIPPDVDEWEARSNIELLNANRNISEPLPWQNLLTLRQIYSQALPTPAKRKIIERIDQLIQDTRSFQVQNVGWVQDSASASMAMNSISSQQTSNPLLPA